MTALCFSPAGDHVLAGSQLGVRVYPWSDWNKERLLYSQSSNIHDLSFSPDGTRFAVAGGNPAEDGRAELFSWPSLEPLRSLVQHTDSALSVAWLDDKTCATSSLDHEIILWNAKTGQVIRRLQGHSRGVTSLCFLDDKILVSAGMDQNLRVWNLESGELLRSLNNHTARVHRLALRPAQSRLPMIASISDDRTVRFWQPTIGRMVRFTRLETTPLDCCWTDQGSLIALACQDGQVRLVDPETTQVFSSLPVFEDWAFSVAAHPEDNSLVVGGRNGKIEIVNYAGKLSRD